MKRNRVILYKGSDDKLEIAIKCSLQDCYNWGGLGICDFCNGCKGYVYLCPELGNKALCPKCFNEHKERVEYYEEDQDYLFEVLDDFINYYKLKFTSEDYELIKQFKESKKHI